MGTWNHRVVELPDGEETIRIICEVYYDDAGNPIMRNDGAKIMWAPDEDPMTTFDRMKRALDKPVLTPEDFKKED